jgi:membrane protein implicated in regulation of membrane protease activity
MRHVYLVLPLLALAVFIFLPFSEAWMLYFPILVVYSIFFSLAWKDRYRPVTSGIEGMIGGIAQVMESGAGQLKVFYHGEIWNALCAERVSRDEKVEITGMEQMKLIVKRCRTHPPYR